MVGGDVGLISAGSMGSKPVMDQPPLRPALKSKRREGGVVEAVAVSLDKAEKERSPVIRKRIPAMAIVKTGAIVVVLDVSFMVLSSGLIWLSFPLGCEDFLKEKSKPANICARSLTHPGCLCKANQKRDFNRKDPTVICCDVALSKLRPT